MIQVAEHDAYTSINCHKEKRRPIECAYRVNDDIGLYANYRTDVNQRYSEDNASVNEYHFSLDRRARALLHRMSKKYERLYLALICVPDKEICCVSWPQINTLIDTRRNEKGSSEESYVIHVALPKGREFRVFVNPPGAKNKFLEPRFKIPRKDFPSRLFEDPVY